MTLSSFEPRTCSIQF